MFFIETDPKITVVPTRLACGGALNEKSIFWISKTCSQHVLHAFLFTSLPS